MYQIACPKGHFSKNAAYLCTKCAPGSYSDKVGLKKCIPCEPGKYTPFDGSFFCNACDPGYFVSPDPPADKATECGYYKYQDEQGQTSCKDCTSNKRKKRAKRCPVRAKKNIYFLGQGMVR